VPRLQIAHILPASDLAENVPNVVDGDSVKTFLSDKRKNVGKISKGRNLGYLHLKRAKAAHIEVNSLTENLTGVSGQEFGYYAPRVRCALKQPIRNVCKNPGGMRCAVCSLQGNSSKLRPSTSQGLYELPDVRTSRVIATEKVSTFVKVTSDEIPCRNNVP
jgi:hypothetical protein